MKQCLLFVLMLVGAVGCCCSDRAVKKPAGPKIEEYALPPAAAKNPPGP
jgi:hypothetical protein